MSMATTYVNEFTVKHDELFNIDPTEVVKLVPSTRYDKIYDNVVKGYKSIMHDGTIILSCTPLKVEIDCSKHAYTPKKVIFNGPATVVFWKDGTKTVVKCSWNDTPDPYNAFCAALAKKIFGNNSIVHKIVESGESQEEKK